MRKVKVLLMTKSIPTKEEVCVACSGLRNVASEKERIDEFGKILWIRVLMIIVMD